MTVTVGIDKIGLYVPQYYIEMTELAQARGVEPSKYTIGIGQDKMAVPPLDQDVVAMAANAAASILDEHDRLVIDQVIVGTESAFDYSKSVASYLHELLDLQPYCKAYEIKQACYGATAGLQSAYDYVRLRPDRKVLVVATDIARYGLGTPGEPTQGAGAVALLISANPRILALDSQSISYTDNQFDFWRPSYSDVALVDGKFSTELYQDCFCQVMASAKQAGLSPESWRNVVFHLPFTKMGKKALDALAQKGSVDAGLIERWQAAYEPATRLGRQVGNIYTGSLYLSLLSYLTQVEDLAAGDSLGLFSYGSGAVAELFSGTLQEGYREALDLAALKAHLERRQALSVQDYERIFAQRLPQEADYQVVRQSQEAGFVLDKIDGHRRYYRQY